MTERREGVLYAFVAYGIWGVVPIYFKWLTFASPDEIIVHRIVWSLLLLLVVVTLRGLWPDLVDILQARRKLAWLFLSGALVAGNWLIFVWALQNERMIEASLGYYIIPLVSVLLGVVFLRERLPPAHVAALVLATVGIVNELIGVGGLPWISLCLALSFGAYGLVRKTVAVDSVLGLTVETALLAPLALLYFVWLVQSGDPAFGRVDTLQTVGLLAAGIVTSIPLVAFAAAALRLPLSVLGFLQYLSPSITLLLAIFLYGEPFRTSHAVTFGCIWSALALFTAAEVYRLRRLSASRAT
jgi:chloramphenicol-sensitive protein RarD